MSDVIVKCGICGEPIKPTKLSKPVPISDWDVKNNFSRDVSFNCCQRSWLISTDTHEPSDCGPAR